MKKILVTGGAGFIGSHLVDRLIEEGFDVISLDSLEAQVHRDSYPDYLNARCHYIWGNCLDRELLAQAIQGVDAVYHLAAIVGVAQSMYEIERYVRGNTLATAVLLEEIIKLERRPEKIIVASSMSVYGEGAYRNELGDLVYVNQRTDEQLLKKQWDYLDPATGGPLRPVPTNEDKPLAPTSIYAIGKRDQEEMVRVIGRAYGIPTVVCRFFNVYGSRQALGNPYTGVAAIFCSRLLNGLPPMIFEDGEQKRDFVHVKDVVEALYLCLINDQANDQTFNIGTGEAISVNEIASLLCEAIAGSKLKPVISGQYRAGDVRHCFADVTKARNLLGFRPSIRFEQGLAELIEWVKKQVTVEDSFEAAVTKGKQTGVIK